MPGPRLGNAGSVAAVGDVVIRTLTPDDLDGAFSLSSTAGWNQQLDDWRTLVAIAPRGGFSAISQERVVGTAIGIDYGGFGWIAMMLVEPAYRGRGLGRRLLEAAIEVVPRDRPIRLDATPLGRPLYQGYGFEDEALLTRYVAPAGSRESGRAAEPLDRSPLVRLLTDGDLSDVARHDAEVFGGNRRSVLEWALGAAPAYGRLVEGDADVPQYCLGRRGRLFDQIGPVVAHDDDTARRLVTAARRETTGQAIAIDAFDRHTAFTGWLRESGFAAERPLFRMRRAPVRGSVSAQDRHSSPGIEFAIFGPEFG